MPPRKLLRTCAVLGVALLFSPSLAAADTGSRVEIRATLGFADTFRLGYWAPLTVTVSNGGAHILGEVQVRLTYRDTYNDGEFTKTHRRHLDLSGASRKRVRFTVFVETFADPLEIRVMSGARVLARHSVDLRRRFTLANLLLVISRDANLDYLNDGDGKRLRVVYPHPELLPDHWQGYDGVAAMVVHGVSLESLGRRQFDALKKWLAQGGRLAVSGGPDYSLLRKPRLAELLPAAPDGLLTVTDAAELGRTFGEPLTEPARFHVHRLVANRGQVTYRTGAVPLVVQQAYGRGNVSYLTFDIASPPFDRWAGMRRLLSAVLRVADRTEPLTRRELRRESPVPAMLDQMPSGFSGHGVLLMFVALYLGILATLYRFRSVTEPGRRILPVLIVACPLLFAPAAYLLFGSLLFPTRASVVIVSVIEPFESGPYARLNLDVGIFSKQRRELRLAFDNPQPGFITNQREHRWGAATSYSVDESAGRVVEIAAPRAYVLHMMQAEDIIPYDVKVTAVRIADGIQLSARNHTGQSWREAWLLADNNIYRLGAVAHQEGSALTLRANRVYSAFEGDSWRRAFMNSNEPGDLDARLTGTALVAALENVVSDLDPSEALLAAIVANPIRLGTTTASWQSEEVALVLFRLPLARAKVNPVAG